VAVSEFELGVILPNYGPDASPAAVRRVAEAAEELGYASIWTTEHLLVGPEAVERFGNVIDSLTCLAWLAGLTERVALGSSIVLAPLHHPVHLAKRAAALQDLSGNRLKLGLGIGWHRDEFDFLGIPFDGRGRRADESIRLMRALWAGEREFHGELWSFENATFGPLPERPPELWIGGSSLRRVLEHDAVWHPSGGLSLDAVRRARKEHPGLWIVPRITATADLDELREAGATGAVLSFAGDADAIVAAMGRVPR
jgi:alkanesulfonate monooxygenase SsuD/methylene tetrahydromethanopterin reductase-like flavin-dependent oxidoreductase (luciferase family)